MNEFRIVLLVLYVFVVILVATGIAIYYLVRTESGGKCGEMHISSILRLLPNRAESRGKYGEVHVSSILGMLPSEFYVWNDIVFQCDGYFVQVDHVVISPYGIFVIETKNYTGRIYGNDDGDQWTKVKYRNKYHFGNPLKQNYSHVKALASLFKMPNHFFVPIVVFLDGADLRCKTKGTVIYANMLLGVIYNHHQVIMSISKVQQLANLLNAVTVETENTRQEHLNYVKYNIYSKHYKIKNRICPRCGGNLKIRGGYNGYFLGCSNYPKCKFTTPL